MAISPENSNSTPDYEKAEREQIAQLDELMAAASRRLKGLAHLHEQETTSERATLLVKIREWEKEKSKILKTIKARKDLYKPKSEEE